MHGIAPAENETRLQRIEAQVAMCREKAGRDGVAIDAAHIYVDRKISGRTIQREGFQAMLAAIKTWNIPEMTNCMFNLP